MNKYQTVLDKFINDGHRLTHRERKEFGAILQELVDKEKPMKPPLKWECAKPQTRCKCSAGVEKYHNYCWNCGQHLDWSDKCE